MTITAERLPDAGAPQVGVTVTGLPAGEQVIDVETSWDGGESWQSVRGGKGYVASGGAFIRDHFPALNLPLLYRVTVRSTGERMETAAPLAVESDRSWLQDALAPRSQVSLVTYWPSQPGEVLVAWGSHAEAAYGQSVEATQILGSAYPVLSVGQRQAASNVPLRVSYDAAVEGGLFKRLLMQASHLVLRTAEHRDLDPVAHVAVTDAKGVRPNPGARQQIAQFEGTVIQGRPINLKFVIPWWTYGQVAAAWAGRSYSDAQGAREGATYLDWQRDPMEGS